MKTAKKKPAKKVARKALVSQGRSASTMTRGQIAHESGLNAARAGQPRKSPYHDVETDMIWLSAYDNHKNGQIA